jgi:hypothetical protein
MADTNGNGNGNNGSKDNTGMLRKMTFTVVGQVDTINPETNKPGRGWKPLMMFYAPDHAALYIDRNKEPYPVTKVYGAPASTLFAPIIDWGRMKGKAWPTRSECIIEAALLLGQLSMFSPQADELDLVGRILMDLTMFLLEEKRADPLTCFFYALAKQGVEPFKTEFQDWIPQLEAQPAEEPETNAA